jgi:ABC-type uncharacterized transport system ATPase subunit
MSEKQTQVLRLALLAQDDKLVGLDDKLAGFEAEEQ